MKLIYYVEYFNTNRSQLKGGFEFYLNPNARNDNRFFFGLGYGLVNSFGYIKGLPDYHISYNKNNGYFFKFGGSDRNLYVLTGISFLNAIDVLTPIKQEYYSKFRLLFMRLIFSLKLDVYLGSISLLG
ncbi:hypothetical protein [Flavobacterium psychrophilum]|uniref:hypothetical protein n=1 Tax=Flavobacterium psychrophilum TaxID=96345 RepID=UPI00141B12A1|nr:hypothetical protein [Flavobacterium psychrophilum]